MWGRYAASDSDYKEVERAIRCKKKERKERAIREKVFVCDAHRKREPCSRGIVRKLRYTNLEPSFKERGEVAGTNSTCSLDAF